MLPLEFFPVFLIGESVATNLLEASTKIGFTWLYCLPNAVAFVTLISSTKSSFVIVKLGVWVVPTNILN